MLVFLFNVAQCMYYSLVHWRWLLLHAEKLILHAFSAIVATIARHYCIVYFYPVFGIFSVKKFGQTGQRTFHGAPFVRYKPP